MNRIGDFMLILAIVLIWQVFGSLEYLHIFLQIELFAKNYMDIAG
jgi:NADH:ubiquinone oxidoreductase subunit 5 (subunit L)/multisubunit Na+/H+ antiporter MnhA subunit